jgi:zinc transporter ZupT
MQNLVLGIVILLAGPFIWKLFESRGLLPWVNKITALCVGFLVAIHILPESYEVIGWWSLVAGGAGFLLFFLLEYLWFLPHKKMHKLTVTLVLVGLCFHMILDGVGLSHGEHHHHHHGEGETNFLSLAILIHRLPAGLLLWSILKGTFNSRISIGLYSLFVVLTATGYLLGADIFHALGEFQLQLMQSFIGGALAHVVVDCLMPHKHKAACESTHAHS